MVACDLVEVAGEAVAVGSVAELLVEPQGGLVEGVDAEVDLGEAAVAGPAVGFSHQEGGNAASLMGLGDDEFLDHGVAARREGRNVGYLKAFQSLDAHQAHDGAIHFSHEERLIGVGQVGIEQPLRAGWLISGSKTVRALACVEGIGLGVEAAGGVVVGGFGEAEAAVHGRFRIGRLVLGRDASGLRLRRPGALDHVCNRNRQGLHRDDREERNGSPLVVRRTISVVVDSGERYRHACFARALSVSRGPKRARCARIHP